MITFPKAKINIGLRITGKRPDGFHNIETTFYPVGLSDALEFIEPGIPLTNDILTVTGLKTGSVPEENIIIKAVRKLREYYSIPFLTIHLHKAIPAGAGLGGGSSDASFFLKTLVRFFNIPVDGDYLRNLATGIGSDCPFFIDCQPSFAYGRGEKLQPVDNVLKGLYIILANPGISISTRDAYANCRPGKPESSLLDLINLPVEQWPNRILNDFEEYAFRLYPAIRSIKQGLYDSGALFSLMTGSGSTVFGIFSGKPELPESIRDHIIYEGMTE